MWQSGWDMWRQKPNTAAPPVKTTIVKVEEGENIFRKIAKAHLHFKEVWRGFLILRILFVFQFTLDNLGGDT
jgi:hypothetical protein